MKLTKYKIKNIDCAACASRLETRLKSNPEIGKFMVDSLNSVLITDMKDISKLRELVKKIEPHAEIEEIKIKEVDTEKSFYGEILQIILVVILLLAGLFAGDQLNKQLFSQSEILIFLAAYFISGWGVHRKAFRNLIKGKIFDEHFLMTIATLGAVIINQIPEAVTVMLFYNIGEYLQDKSIQKNRKSIKALLSIRPNYANRVVENRIIKVSPEEVQTGDTILVKPGEKVPLDGKVIKGESYLDTFMLTGESVPRTIKQGEEALSGMINKSEPLFIQVSRSFAESSFTKIINLVENASHRKAKTERFISSFAYYYTPVVVFLAAAASLLPPLIFPAQTFEDWIYRALVMLVVSCPCALVISIPLGYFAGVGGASRNGILIKGSNFLDVLTEVRTVVFDKTGTLSKGVFKVTRITPAENFTKEELLKFAAYAEFLSNHPIAKSIISSYPGRIDAGKISGYNEITGKGIRAVVDGKEILAGSKKLLEEENISSQSSNAENLMVHIAVDKVYAGHLMISDELRENSLNTLEELHNRGIKKIMLTGDSKSTASFISKKLNIDEYYAELMPADKVSYLEKIMAENPGGKTAFVGDGVNDAPVIARSDVGIAMGGLGSDAAVEAADIVIMQDDPSKIIVALNIAAKTRRIIWQNILFALSVKIVFIILGGAGLAAMWEAVFGDMGVALIAILNSARSFRN